MRRSWPWVLVTILAGGGFLLTWLFLHSPYYSLYQIGKAIHHRQPRLFLAYVDIDHILESQSADFVDQFMPKKKLDSQTSEIIRGVIKAVAPTLAPQVKERVVQAVADPDRNNIPTSWTLVIGASVTVNGDSALVILKEPDQGRRLRLGMRRLPEQGHWRVVEINPADLKVLVDEYLEAMRHKEPPMPTSLPAAPPPAAPAPAGGQ